MYMLLGFLCYYYDSSIGIATGYGQNGQDSISGRGKVFSLLYSVQTDSGAHLDSHPMDAWGSFAGYKAARACC
jgi:hypothetical protein